MNATVEIPTILAIRLREETSGRHRCTYPRTQTSYTPGDVEQPRPVDFFYGRLVDVHRASLEYPYEAGIGLGAGISPYLAGLHLTGGPGPYGGLKITAAFVDIIPSGSAPNVEADEYTYC